MFQVICIATGKPVVVYAVYGGMFLIWNDEETERCWSWMDMDQFRPMMDGTGGMTRADRIRSLNDEQLAEEMYINGDAQWCRNLPECGKLLDADEGIDERKCIACVLSWLKQPAEGVAE